MLRLRISAALPILLLSIMVSCQRAGDAALLDTGAASTSRVIATSLDSCSKLRWSGDTARIAAGYANAWATGAVRNVGTFNLFVPDSTRATVTDTLLGGVTLAWPGCPLCRFDVTVIADSTNEGIDGRVARMLASQRVIDSINADSNTVAMEFDEIDGPPKPFVTTTGRGYWADENCGDCLAVTLLFGRPGYIATISLGGDAGVPLLGRRVCEMVAVGKTLQWRP